MGFLSGMADRFRQGLERSRQAMSQGLDDLLALGRQVDESMLDELEELLLAADLGAETSQEFVSRGGAEAKRDGSLYASDLRILLRQLLEETLVGAAAALALDART